MTIKLLEAIKFPRMDQLREMLKNVKESGNQESLSLSCPQPTIMTSASPEHMDVYSLSVTPYLSIEDFLLPPRS